MQNENTQSNDNTSFNDQANGGMNNVLNNAKEKLAKGVTTDDDEQAGATYSKNLMNRAETQVRENEDASLQDDTYAFDEDNTENEEYHDAEDIDFDNDDDYISE